MNEELFETGLDRLGLVESEVGGESEQLLGTAASHWNGLEHDGEGQKLGPAGLQEAHLIVECEAGEAWKNKIKTVD